LSLNLDSTPSLSRRLLIISSLVIFGISLALRLWEFNLPPYPVFDEVHFSKSAASYISGNPPNDGHPPLGKYIIALGITIFGHNETGYRITEILLGACIPTLVTGLMYRLTHNSLRSIIAGVLTLTDGLFLVESRLGLLNIFLVCFGLCSQILLMVGLERKAIGRTLMLSLAGIMLGASASIKWNGLGFTLTTYLLICMTIALKKFFPKRFSQIGILADLCELKWYEYLFCLGILPVLIYVLSWLPHLMMVLKVFSPQSQGWYWFEALGKFFVSSNSDLYLFHTSSGSVATSDHPIHPYCASAVSWAFLMRPMGYYFNSSGNEWRVVQALGNPILWWLSTLSILPIAFWGIWRGCSISTYVLAGYVANYLPWFAVKRCLFIYHYMSSAAFSFMALALVIYWLITQGQIWRKSIGLSAIVLVVVCQIFFMPIWLGLPISSQEFYQRIWFLPNVVPGFNWI
jgi:dolichyl-phosphate-mannose-protein mannosyltransferase